jgi:hypothetical protein
MNKKRVELMEYYAEQGRTLESILSLIGVKRETAMKYAREHNILFPDHKRRKRKDEE